MTWHKKFIHPRNQLSHVYVNPAIDLQYLLKTIPLNPNNQLKITNINNKIMFSFQNAVEKDLVCIVLL